jgi:hypothetical protein
VTYYYNYIFYFFDQVPQPMGRQVDIENSRVATLADPAHTTGEPDLAPKCDAVSTVNVWAQRGLEPVPTSRVSECETSSMRPRFLDRESVREHRRVACRGESVFLTLTPRSRPPPSWLRAWPGPEKGIVS